MKKSECIAKEMREGLAVQVFINGLDDRNLALAVKVEEPHTLNEALNLVKNLKIENNEEIYLNRIYQNKNDCSEEVTKTSCIFNTVDFKSWS